MVKPYQNKTWLYQQYVVQGRSIEEIAKRIGVSHQTIYRYLQKYDLIRNPRSFS